MSEKKTLGQVLHDAEEPHSDYTTKVDGSYQRRANGIVAVCRAVVDERIIKHVESYHANELSDDEAKTLLSLPVAHEHGVSRDPPKPEAASEAGDWAMDIVDAGWRSGSDLAAKIREAAERRYGQNATIGSVRYYEQQLENLRQGIEKLTKERDAAVAEVERLRAELKQARIAMDDVRCWDEEQSALPDRIVRQLDAIFDDKPAAIPAPAPVDDDLIRIVQNTIAVNIESGSTASTIRLQNAVFAAIRPLFDAVRAERDEAKAKLIESHKPSDNDDWLSELFAGEFERWEQSEPTAPVVIQVDRSHLARLYRNCPAVQGMKAIASL